MSTAALAIGSALSFVALQLADTHVFKPQGMSCMCPPLAAVAVLLFAMPKAPASSIRSVIGGHILSATVAFLVVNYLPSELADFEKPIAVATSIVLMQLTGTLHPPAGAYAFLFVDKRMGLLGIVSPGLSGALVLLLCQQLYLTMQTMSTPTSAAKKDA